MASHWWPYLGSYAGSWQGRTMSVENDQINKPEGVTIVLGHFAPLILAHAIDL